MSFRRFLVSGTPVIRHVLCADCTPGALLSQQRLGSQKQTPNESRGAGPSPGAAAALPLGKTPAVGDSPAGGSGTQTPGKSNRFLQRLSELEKSAAHTTSGSSGFSQAYGRGREANVLKERKRMLVFRDVGMDLDKPILSRDVFLVFKYFRYGIEFAVDNELERMLRYFNEHALNELKIIQNSKLMRGPAVLSRKRSRAGQHGGVSFQDPPAFPSLQAANVRQFCTYTSKTEQRVADLMKPSSLCASFRREGDFTVNSWPRARYFCEQDLAQMTSFSSLTFRKPAVIIYSQLGQKLGGQADLEWRRLAYATIYPSLLQYLPQTDTRGEGHVQSTCEQHSKGGLRQRPKDASAGGRENIMPIDVISLRSMDVYKYRWVHRLYARRFAQSLLPGGASLGSMENEAQINGLITASTTFVGCKLLQPFYSVLGLRNYLSPHVMLVDHEGVIRWLTAGCPDDYERKHFPLLLRQLEEEYYRARSR